MAVSLGSLKFKVRTVWKVDGLPIGTVGFEAPLLHRVESGAGKHEITFDELHVAHRTVACDPCLQNNRSLEMLCKRLLRIVRFYPVNQQAERGLFGNA